MKNPKPAPLPKQSKTAAKLKDLKPKKEAKGGGRNQLDAGYLNHNETFLDE